jgi:hypothetical protein
MPSEPDAHGGHWVVRKVDILPISIRVRCRYGPVESGFTTKGDLVMAEETMVRLVQEALATRGITEEILAVGQFYPRGHTGGMFAGGLAGGEAGGLIGGAAESVGVGAGSLAGMHAADKVSGLPGTMLVGVSEETVYGFAARSRHTPPTALVFQVARSSLIAKVHKRFNVRILELLDTVSGSTVELEGNRLPMTHSKDVIDLLS